MDRLKLPFAIVGIALWTLILGACHESAEVTENAVTPNPIVYEITNRNGDIEGWMLGTIHALPKNTEWRTPTIEAVINDADLLMVEVANLKDREQVTKILTRLSRSPDLPKLWARIGHEHRPALDEMLDRSPFSMADFDETETWAAALMLSQVGAEGDPAYGVDRAVIADFTGREIVELEGAEKQLRIFDGLPVSDQRDLLEGVIIEADAAPNERGKLRNAWLTGDVAVLERATKAGIMADRELRDALLVERNKDWAITLAAALKKPEMPLVAVGAAHLVGSDSLPEFLSGQGYSVQIVQTQ